MSKGLEDYKVISVPTTMAEIKRLQKEHKALEIIKNNLDSGTLGFDFKVDDKKTYKLEIYGLAQEEYELLKEVLL